MHKKVMRRQKGFTLVELAIVLVIIGLILGAVLKGQEMIKNARVKRLVSQIDGYRAAVFAFYDRFGMFPGDENLTGIPSGDAHNGDGSGQISYGERAFVWEDLSKAGFITGNFDGTNNPRHPFGDEIILYWHDPDGGGAAADNHWFRLYNLPWDVCFEIDRKYDDGLYSSGSIIASEPYTPSSENIGTLDWLM